MSRRSITIASLVCLAVPSVASGQQRSVADALSVPDGVVCTTREALAESVEAWLGHAEVAPSLSILLVLEGADEREGVSFVVLEGDRTLARRRFERLPGDCADRRAALSLAIAIAIDATILESLGVIRPDEHAPMVAAGQPELPPRAQPRETGGPRQRVPGERPREPRPAVTAFAALLVGAMPRPVLAGGASVEVRFAERWAVAVRGIGTAETRIALGGGFAAAQLAYGVATGCMLGGTPHLALDACAGVLGGTLVATGHGYSETREAQVGWAAAVLRVASRWPRSSPVAVTAGFEGWLSLVRPRLSVQDPSGEVLSAVGFPVAGLGLDLGLWMGF